MAIKRKGLSDKLAAFLKDQSFVCDAGPVGSAQLVMLRGCKINADGSISAHGDPLVYDDRYGDVMFAFGNKSGGQQYLEAYRASAKPGLAWIKHPSYSGSSQGCPTVQPGQYRYCRGDHRGHEAMRQCANSPVVVIRDLDDDARLEQTDLVDYPEWTGINIHAGGTSDRVGLNSSGCQVIWGGWNGDQWQSFHYIVYRIAAKQKVFHYTLADFSMFAAWHDKTPKLTSKHVFFGSSGEAVTTVQKRLASVGYFGAALIDGKFGRGTDRAVRAHQKASSKPVTGIVAV